MPRDVRLAVLLVVALPVFARAQAQPAGDAAKARADAASQRAGAAEIWTDHLKLRTYASQPAIAPGGRVSLILEIEPGDRMHVYAPGADDYRVITLTVATQPFIRLSPVQYPASEIYVFEPLDERIPVYQKPFTLIQELMLDKTRGACRARQAFADTEGDLGLSGVRRQGLLQTCLRPAVVDARAAIRCDPASQSGADASVRDEIAYLSEADGGLVCAE